MSCACLIRRADCTLQLSFRPNVPIYCFSRSGIGVDSIGHMTGIGQRLCGLRGTHGWSAVLGIRNVEFLTGHILRQLDPKRSTGASCVPSRSRVEICRIPDCASESDFSILSSTPHLLAPSPQSREDLGRFHPSTYSRVLHWSFIAAVAYLPMSNCVFTQSLLEGFLLVGSIHDVLVMANCHAHRTSRIDLFFYIRVLQRPNCQFVSNDRRCLHPSPTRGILELIEQSPTTDNGFQICNFEFQCMSPHVQQLRRDRRFHRLLGPNLAHLEILETNSLYPTLSAADSSQALMSTNTMNVVGLTASELSEQPRREQKVRSNNPVDDIH
jgi:hypothetical protein